jgi:hypothetical protein
MDITLKPAHSACQLNLPLQLLLTQAIIKA